MNVVKHYPFTLVCLITVWILSFFTPPQTPLDNVPFMDKWVHIAMYCGTCSVLWLEYERQHHFIHPKWALTVAILCPIMMSGAIELLQEYCTGGRRRGDWLDFAANSVGVMIAALIGRFIFAKFMLKRN